jgi:hypothetical protein
VLVIGGRKDGVYGGMEGVANKGVYIEFWE